MSNSLTQHGPGDFMEDWLTNFGAQIGLEAFTPTKMGFCEILHLFPFLGQKNVKNMFLSITRLQLISQ